MSQYRRTKKGRVDSRQQISFSFDGKTYQGLKGDTLASALLANGVHLVGRSFKYHRPRGIMAAGSDEANALVAFDRGEARVTPNMRATTLELYDGFKAQSQNNWPSLNFDVTAINDRLSAFFPAGFYNKTFMWPKSFWDKVYEPAIRATAGLGPAPKAADPDKYDANYTHCETLIVGAGPAGIAAARAAAKKGGRVILVDEQGELGGSLLSAPDQKIDGQPAWDWLAESLAELDAAENVTLMPRTTAIGYYHDNFLGLAERLTDHLPEDAAEGPRERLHRVWAQEVILATGAIERPLVFAGNDRPGVMLASAAQTFLNRYGVAVGEKIAVVTGHDSAYKAAFDLSDADIEIAVIVDCRAQVDQKLIAEAEKRGISLRTGHTVTATKGRHRVKSITINKVNGDQVDPAGETLECDALIMSGGWTPSVHLWSHSKGSLQWRDDIAAYVPDKPNENAICVGACNGDFGIGAAMAAGAKAAGGDHTFDVDDTWPWTGAGTLEILPTHRDESRIKAFVDFQNDVTAKDIRLAVREGFKSIEHIKRYTTTGMATDQGKTSNLNGLQIAASALGRPVPQVGLTTFRPPYTPTTYGALAGNNGGAAFDVVRKTSIDGWAEEHGAVFEPVGLWRRARYFPRDGEDMHQAVAREGKATRDSLGIFDASTLGKIEVVGPDAAEFLNRMYTNPWTKLGVGRCRYGLMLGEDGYIMDDGVIGRLADDRFHVTTTTGGAPRVLAHMEDYLQTEWPDLDVWLTSITEQWAVIALNGPNARKLIEPFVEGVDLSSDAFPHMAVRECKVCGIDARLFRVSFSGELGFEINVPAHYGRALWETLYAAGQQYDITPYGTEVMHVLRAEKGFIIVGQDTDGTVTPYDAGMSWAIGKKKKDFVGKRSLARPDIVAEGRKQLVGLMTKNPKTVLEEGAQIVMTPNQSIPMEMVGHVTSSYWSETLGHSIALALVADGHDLKGQTIYVPMPDEMIEAEIVDTIFYDKQGEQLNVF
ncbi:sarcosine oxidase subunit alpha [Maritalea mediterranea]|uniref:Sarcosine oxidase subunit alpha n=1 Tax=Maritalea mediterranea TaxID=2909667 RepID=A0ABS9E6F2_9HYPH|nr:sarcosine oxidase subunit alpha [Maritalea mediterranea]MCF4098450.1 sarcosine oxidase subunit alpha [Maritalea mediterranea]